MKQGLVGALLFYNAYVRIHICRHICMSVWMQTCIHTDTHMYVIYIYKYKKKWIVKRNRNRIDTLGEISQLGINELFPLVVTLNKKSF